MTLSEGTVADHVAARDLVVALLEGQEDVLFKARGCIFAAERPRSRS